MRRWLWILIVLAVPVPFFAGRNEAAPIAPLAARLVTALVQDGGPVTNITALVAAQAIGYRGDSEAAPDEPPPRRCETVREPGDPSGDPPVRDDPSAR